MTGLAKNRTSPFGELRYVLLTKIRHQDGKIARGKRKQRDTEGS